MRVASILALLFSLSAAFPEQPSAPTVGGTLLLANQPWSETRQPLEQALRAPDARVRLVAARVLAVRGDASSAQAVAAALASEKDSEAGGEMVRALLLLKGAAGVAEASQQASRLGGHAFGAYLTWVAREKPPQFASSLASAPAGAALPIPSLIGSMSVAASESKFAPDILGAWMRIAPPRAWAAALERVPPSDDLRPLNAVLVDALASPNRWVREETLWFLLDTAARGERIPATIASAASAPSGSAIGSWEDFGRELLARHTGKRAAVDGAQFLSAQKTVETLRPALRLKLLTAAEDAAIAPRRPKDDLPLEERFSARDFLPTRTIELWMNGLLDDTARLAGCPLSSTASYGLARVLFNADGRPREVDLDVTRTPKSCIPVLRALALTDLADEDRHIERNRPQTLVLPFGGPFPACGRVHVQSIATTPSPDRPSPQPINISIPPLSYELQQSKSRPGDVTAEVAVTSRGCVSRVRILKGSGMEIADVFYVRALAEWSFLPAVINGAPAPFTFMTKQGFKWKSAR